VAEHDASSMVNFTVSLAGVDIAKLSELDAIHSVAT